MQHSLHFHIAGFFAQRGDHVIGEIETMPLSCYVPVTFVPLSIHAVTGRRQIVQSARPGDVVRLALVKVRPVIARDSEMQSLPDRIPGAAYPAAELPVVENAA